MIQISEIVSIKELANKLNQPIAEVIKKLIAFGVLANLNDDIDFDTASIIADEFGVQAEKKELGTWNLELGESSEKSSSKLQAPSSKLQPRPPVVTIMGHVDHGKTTLLDTIRKTTVAQNESGGITQHVSAYQVEIQQKTEDQRLKTKSVLHPPSSVFRTITFIDTPGHAAFEATRKHGAFIADLIILVVAADDGVKPQTIEVINLANERNIPILVAINKVDKPEADVEKTKRQLAELGLVPEEWGGSTVISLVSATTGLGVDKMLEMIFLISDLKELKADPNVSATGVIIESHMTPGIGPQSTILIQNGCLKLSDCIVSGEIIGKIRTIIGGDQKKTSIIKPGYCGIISGISGLPEFGNQFFVVEDEKNAKNIAKDYQRKKSVKTIKSLNFLKTATEQDQGKIYYKIILKADTEASSQAIISSLKNLENDDVGVKIISSDIGDINESDISYAKTAHSTIVGFNVDIGNELKKLARREQIEVSLYTIIYELVENVESILKALMPTIKIEIEMASLKILAIFRNNKKNQVLGGVVRSGVLTKGLIKIFHGEKLIAKGKIVKLEKGKQDAKQVESGSECGVEIQLTEFEELKLKDLKIMLDDSIVLYEIREQKKPWQ